MAKKVWAALAPLFPLVSKSSLSLFTRWDRGRSGLDRVHPGKILRVLRNLANYYCCPIPVVTLFFLSVTHFPEWFSTINLTLRLSLVCLVPRGYCGVYDAANSLLSLQRDSFPFSLLSRSLNTRLHLIHSSSILSFTLSTLSSSDPQSMAQSLQR